MIKFFREQKRHFFWVIWAVILVFVLFVFVDFGSSGSSGVTGNAAAMVNGDRISLGEFHNNYRRAEQRYADLFGGALDDNIRKSLGLPRQVLLGMVSDRLLLQEARRLKLKVSDQEVAEEIKNAPSFQEDDKFIGKARYLELLERNGLTAPLFEAQITDDLMIRKLRQLLESSFVLSDDVLRKEWSRRNEKASVEYIQLETGGEEDAVTLEDAEIRAWFDENTDLYHKTERRKVNYLLVDSSKLRETIEVTEDEMRSNYAANLEDYKQAEETKARHILIKPGDDGEEAAKTRAQGLLDEILSGGDFDALARLHSEDPGSGAKGGDLGFFGRGRMVPEFEEVAFATEVGTVHPELVKSQFGYHIIEPTDRKPAGYRPFDEVQAGIRFKLQTNKVDELGKVRAQGLIAGFSGAPTDDDLRAVTDDSGIVTFNTTDPFESGDTIPGVGAQAEFHETVFALAEPGLVSAPIRIPRGWIVARVAEVVPAGLPAFEEARDEAEVDARRAKAQLALTARFDELLPTIDPSAGLAGLAEALEAEVKGPTEVRRSGAIAELGDGGQALIAKVFSDDRSDMIGPLSVPGGGVLVARVIERTELDDETFTTERDSLRETVQREEASLLVQAMLQQALESNEIQVNTEEIDRLTGS